MVKISHLLSLIFLFLFLAVPLQPITRTMDNPQLLMVGSRVISLGVNNPVLEGDINAIFINPASIANTETMPFSFSSQRILGEFQYFSGNVSLPVEFKVPFEIDGRTMTQKLQVGLSYGNIALDDIPETTLDNGVIRSEGTFGAGFHLFQASVGTIFFDMFGFDNIAVGAAGKYLSQYIDSEDRGAFAMDVGAIGVYNLDTGIIDRAHVGISVLNMLSTGLEWEINGERATLPLEFYVGGRVDMLNEQLSLFANNSQSDAGVAVGAEYALGNNMFFRGSTDFSRNSFGTGLVFDNIVGFGQQEYSLRLDYAMTLNEAPFSSKPDHTLSFTVLGDSRPFSPKILKPAQGFLTSDRLVDLSGIGPRNTAVRIYNNDVLVRTAMTDRYGKWTFTGFPIQEGENMIVVRSYTLADDLSLESDPVTIVSDTTPPNLDLSIFPDGSDLVIHAIVSPDVEDIVGIVADYGLEFDPESEGVWRARMPIPPGLEDGATIPSEFSFLEIAAIDEAGNETIITDVPFFVKLDFPNDKYVHLKDHIRLIGTASPMVRQIRFGENPVYIDQNDRFSFYQKLNPGKNFVEMTLQALDGEEYHYGIRVLRLQTYDDVLDDTRYRRSIQFMSTLGILGADVDGLFRPLSPVTRGYMAKLLVNARQLDVPDSDTVTAFFVDVTSQNEYAPYIQTAIEEGVMFVFPDGTFRPEAPMTLDEVVFYLRTAELIGDDEFDDGDRVITRAELADFLSYQPRYELEIERLINFDIGY